MIREVIRDTQRAQIWNNHKLEHILSLNGRQWTLATPSRRGYRSKARLQTLQSRRQPPNIRRCILLLPGHRPRKDSSRLIQDLLSCHQMPKARLQNNRHQPRNTVYRRRP